MRKRKTLLLLLLQDPGTNIMYSSGARFIKKRGGVVFFGGCYIATAALCAREDQWSVHLVFDSRFFCLYIVALGSQQKDAGAAGSSSRIECFHCCSVGALARLITYSAVVRWRPTEPRDEIIIIIRKKGGRTRRRKPETLDDIRRRQSISQTGTAVVVVAIFPSVIVYKKIYFLVVVVLVFCRPVPYWFHVDRRGWRWKKGTTTRGLSLSLYPAMRALRRSETSHSARGFAGRCLERRRLFLGTDITGQH